MLLSDLISVLTNELDENGDSEIKIHDADTSYIYDLNEIRFSRITRRTDKENESFDCLIIDSEAYCGKSYDEDGNLRVLFKKS